MELVDTIMALCAAKGITLNQLEKAIGLKSTIARWKDHSPSIDKVVLVAKYFGLTVSELIGETKNPALMDEDGRNDAFMRLVPGLFGDHPEKLLPLLDSLEKEPEKTRAKFDLFLATL